MSCGNCIQIEGLDELERRLGRVAAIETLREPMEKSTLTLQSELKKYPAPSHKKMRFKSRKQRLFVIISIRKGDIKVPYHRRHSAGLSGSWTRHVAMRNGTLTGTVASNKSYGPFVMGPKRQAAYHAGTWRTTKDIVRKVKNPIETIFKNALNEALA